jgi:hypothetical protein
MIRPLLVAALLPLLSAAATEARVVKVLPHRLDSQGRHALSPSLYERDAYQAELRAHPDRIRGLRIDVLWSLKERTSVPCVLRLELRGAKGADPVVLERPVSRGFLRRRWTKVLLDPAEFEKVGDVSAWRVSLRSGGEELASTASFLW